MKNGAVLVAKKCHEGQGHMLNDLDPLQDAPCVVNMRHATVIIKFNKHACVTTTNHCNMQHSCRVKARFILMQ